MYRDWGAGDKLVCVDAGACKCSLSHCKTNYGLKENEIYVVSGMEDRGKTHGIAVVIKGHETNIGIHTKSQFRGLSCKRFRKLNKPDELHGSKEDFIKLWDNHRIKTKVPAITERG